MAIDSGSWVDTSVAGRGAVLEAVGAVIDPIGTLASAEAGWVIEYVELFQEALDMLAGNATLIETTPMTWDDVTYECFVMSEQRTSILADVRSWTDAVADACRGVPNADAEVLACVGGAAYSFVARRLVSKVREFSRDFVAECIGSPIAWSDKVPFTARIGPAWLIPKAVMKITERVGKISGRLTGLIDSPTVRRDLLFG